MSSTRIAVDVTQRSFYLVRREWLEREFLDLRVSLHCVLAGNILKTTLGALA